MIVNYDIARELRGRWYRITHQFFLSSKEGSSLCIKNRCVPPTLSVPLITRYIADWNFLSNKSSSFLACLVGRRGMQISTKLNLVWNLSGWQKKRHRYRQAARHCLPTAVRERKKLSLNGEKKFLARTKRAWH
jgi:hypothetical protein